jgi:cysteine desulfurase
MSQGEVVFTSGGTEANNIAIMGYAHALNYRGNHIITTKIEHPSVLRAMESLEMEGFHVDYLSVDQSGLISLDELESLLTKDTILVSIMHVNNEIGAVQPLKECAKIIKMKSRAIFHTDAVQSFGKIEVDLSADGPDVLTVSSHKLHGLNGSGILAMKPGIAPKSINFGGGQEKGLRSGTVSVADAVATAKAMRLSILDSKSADFSKWRTQLISVISIFDKVKILAQEAGAPHILSIAFKNVKGEVAVNYFQENGIIISTSSACSSKNSKVGHVIKAIGLSEDYNKGVIRISFGKNNTEQELEKVEIIFKQFMELLERGTN